jgi:hypothetical protein
MLDGGIHRVEHDRLFVFTRLEPIERALDGVGVVCAVLEPGNLFREGNHSCTAAFSGDEGLAQNGVATQAFPIVVSARQINAVMPSTVTATQSCSTPVGSLKRYGNILGAFQAMPNAAIFPGPPY